MESHWADLFPSMGDAVFAIPAAGGQPEAVTKLDRTAGETAHIAPYFLPEGRRFLYVVQNADGKRSGLYVGEVGSSLPDCCFRVTSLRFTLHPDTCSFFGMAP